MIKKLKRLLRWIFTDPVVTTESFKYVEYDTPCDNCDRCMECELMNCTNEFDKKQHWISAMDNVCKNIGPDDEYGTIRSSNKKGITTGRQE